MNTKSTTDNLVSTALNVATNLQSIREKLKGYGYLEDDDTHVNIWVLEDEKVYTQKKNVYGCNEGEIVSESVEESGKHTPNPPFRLCPVTISETAIFCDLLKQWINKTNE